ncbi:MAG: hypothetical protein ACRECJ_02785, partial [Limisphaerales bacterium]
IPNNAINALEMLDEPGVASDKRANGFFMNGTVENLAVRSITAPADGYVLAIATAEVAFGYTSSSAPQAQFGVSDVAGTFQPDANFHVSENPGGNPTGGNSQVVTVHGLFSVNAGTSTFYFLGEKLNISANSWFYADAAQLSLIYLPTAYGTVTPTKSAFGGPEVSDKASVQRSALTAADIAAEQAEAEKFNAERVARELAQVKAEMEALRKEVREQKQQEVDD